MIALLLGAASWTAAQSISYTVQVVALSDRDAALTVVSDLLRQGYPAYVVRSTSTQGDVFRVRVGAYANRGAAVLYAAAMPAVAGGQPVPALAEAIPPGITPLAPRLLVEERTAGADVRLIPLADDLGVRIQLRAPLAQAEYLMLSGGGVERVRAWQFAVRDDGTRVRVRDMALWPESWRDDSEEVREGFRSSLIGLVAERLGVPAEQVAAAEYHGATDDVPRLIVVERLAPGATDIPELLGIGLPASGLTPSGPVAYLGVDSSELPGLPAGVRVDVTTGEVEGTWNGVAVERRAAGEGDAVDGVEAVVGEGWIAVPDGPFIRLTLVPDTSESGGDTGNEAPGDAPSDASSDEATAPDTAQATPQAPPAPTGVTWRAAVGLPLWSDGAHLVAVHDESLLIYDFLPR
ncbi:MAG: SPOR domain-containing protein [Trueperaceae bacterium]